LKLFPFRRNNAEKKKKLNEYLNLNIIEHTVVGNGVLFALIELKLLLHDSIENKLAFSICLNDNKLLSSVPDAKKFLKTSKTGIFSYNPSSLYENPEIPLKKPYVRGDFSFSIPIIEGTPRLAASTMAVPEPTKTSKLLTTFSKSE